MNRTSLFQAVRLVAMVAAIAGIIYAVEFMQGGFQGSRWGSFALWFWVAVLGVGFVGLLASFRLTQRRITRQREKTTPRRKKRRR